MSLRCSDRSSPLQRQKSIVSQDYILVRDTTALDVNNESTKEPRHKWYDGYHFGKLCCVITAATVLFVNIILMAKVSSDKNVTDGLGILQDGDCNETKRLDLWLHFLINIPSTLLLGASNYSMQCLSAPSRKDIDTAHS